MSEDVCKREKQSKCYCNCDAIVDWGGVLLLIREKSLGTSTKMQSATVLDSTLEQRDFCWHPGIQSFTFNDSS